MLLLDLAGWTLWNPGNMVWTTGIRIVSSYMPKWILETHSKPTSPQTGKWKKTINGRELLINAQQIKQSFNPAWLVKFWQTWKVTTCTSTDYTHRALTHRSSFILFQYTPQKLPKSVMAACKCGGGWSGSLHIQPLARVRRSAWSQPSEEKTKSAYGKKKLPIRWPRHRS